VRLVFFGSPPFVVWHPYPQGSAQQVYLEETVLPQLKSEHRGVAVQAVFVDSSDVRGRLLQAQSDGTLPDVAVLDALTLAELSQQGVLAPLDGQDGLVTYDALASGAIPGAADAGMVGGQRVGIPLEASTQVLAINPALLEADGLAAPVTLESLWDVCQALADAESETCGFVLDGLTLENLAPFFWSNGGELLDAEGTGALGALNTETNAALLEALVDATSNNSLLVAAGDEALAVFAQGRAGMLLADSAALAALREDYPAFEFEVVPFPAGDAGSSTVLDCRFLAMTREANTEMSFRLMELLLSEEAQAGMAGGSFLPVNVAALKSLTANDQTAGAMALALPTARTLPLVGSAHDLQNEFALAITQVEGGYKSPQQALDDLAPKFEAYLPLRAQ
jgi:multiple sugar transport system substrate-binding protein